MSYLGFLGLTWSSIRLRGLWALIWSLGVGVAVTKVCIFSVKSLLFSLVSLSKLESYQY